MKKVNISKSLVISKLYSLVEDYDKAKQDDVDCKVKPADVIAALKQICVMKGYLEPTVSKVIQEIEIEF